MNSDFPAGSRKGLLSPLRAGLLNSLGPIDRAWWEKYRPALRTEHTAHTHTHTAHRVAARQQLAAGSPPRQSQPAAQQEESLLIPAASYQAAA
jgi:hypothetical protein